MTKVIIVLCIIIFVLEGVQLAANHALSTDGKILGRLQSEAAAVNQDNDHLRQQILTAESYQTISVKAKEAGFIPATYLYLK